MGKLQIKKYKTSDAMEIMNWIDNKTSYTLWCNSMFGKYPISAGDINRFYDSIEEIAPYSVYDDDKMIGHFTLRKIDDSECRLGFVIVDSSKRGKGYGKKIVHLAVKRAFEMPDIQIVSLQVFKNNTSAFECYKSCGFKEMEIEMIDGMVYPFYEMRIYT